MKTNILRISTLAAITSLLFTDVTFAATSTGVSATSGTTTTTSGTRLATIISKGDSEINRRLSSLATLTTKINAATKLSPADKTALTSQVTSTVSGLTALKTKLDAETTPLGALTDAQSIYSEYRVYALVLPKVYLVKTADDQQAAEAKLSTLADTIQARLTSAGAKGKNVSTEQTTLADYRTQLATATGISTSIETAVVGLQPTDYNSDHTLLSGDNDKLKTAQTAIEATLSDAKTIISGLHS